MKKALPLFLALTALFLGVISFRLWQKLRATEAMAAGAEAQRLALLARVDDLEKRERKLQADANVQRQGSATDRPRNAEVANGFLRMGPGGPPAAQIMESPEVRRLMAIEQKGRLDGRYAALFKALNLPPEQLEKLKQLLVDKQSAPMDVIAEARAQGMTGPESRAQIQELVKATNSEINENIRASLGDAAFQQYQQYEQTAPQRNVVDQLSSRLSYSDAPLSPTQSTQLIAALAASAGSSATNGDSARLPFGIGGPGTAIAIGGTAGGTITDAAIASVQGMLTSSQLSALRQLQAEQQAQQQMGQVMRDSFRNGGGGPAPGANGGPTVPTTRSP